MSTPIQSTPDVPVRIAAEFPDLEGLRRLARRLVRDEADSDDLVQESILLFLRRAPGRIRDLGGWLRGVMRWKARDSRRAAARRRAHETGAQPPGVPMNPAMIAERVEVHERMLAALKELPEPYRSALWLRFVDGLESTEVAAQLELPVETVRTHVKRGVERLRADLDRRSGGDRGAWVPSLALFAGVEPGLAVASAAGGSAKLLGAAAAVVILAAAGIRIVVATRTAGELPAETADAQAAPGLLWSSRPSPVSATDEVAMGGTAAADLQQAMRTVRSETADGTEAAVPPTPGAVREFKFHYQQGYSFAGQRVTDDPESADVWFESCAGGISSIILTAASGILVPLAEFKDATPELTMPEALARAVVRIEAPPKSSETLSTDDRFPHTNAFLLKTRAGRWVAAAITHRGDEGDWTENLATVRYAVAQEGGTFAATGRDVSRNGVVIDVGAAKRMDAELLAQEARLRRERHAPFRARLEELDRRAAWLQPEIQAREGRSIRVAAVLSWLFAKPMGRDDAYEVSTYHFAKATRDVSATNAWDFVFDRRYDGVSLEVPGIRSRVFALGPIGFAEALRGAPALEPPARCATLTPNAMYLVHSLDAESDRVGLLRVEAIVPGESLIFSWCIPDDPVKLLGRLVPGEATMRGPSGRIQIRGGFGGGNPRQVALDGGTSIDVQKRSEQPLDLTSPLNNSEEAVTYVEGGAIPTGKVFLIERIEVTARVEGDGNCHGAFLLFAGPLPIAVLVTERGSEAFRCWMLQSGSRAAAKIDNPFRGSLDVAIPLRRGQEHLVRAQITNRSWCDVTVSGRFVPASEAPPHRPDGNAVEPLQWRLEDFDKAGADVSGTRKLSGSDPVLEERLKTILPFVGPGPARQRLEAMLAALRR